MSEKSISKLLPLLKNQRYLSNVEIYNREKDVYFADDEFTLQINDKLILFSDSQSIKEVEKFSEVNIEFF